MSHPLNPALYRRLRLQFGSVKIVNEGQAMIARPARGAGKPRLLFLQDGEYYVLNCPYCRDTRFRLYVNHMFGQRDVFDRRMNFLAYCFNEGCLYRDQHKRDFWEKMQASNDLSEVAIREGEVLSEEARTVLWPGLCRLLDKYPDTHEARAYIRERGFNPDALAEHYQVCYCEDSHYFLAKDRLIIPVFEGGELKGWQARYVGELPWKNKNKKSELPPKYFSCPGSQFRSKCIYNWDHMKNWQTGILVEGPTDAWRFGAMAGCIFGNTLTMEQRTKVFSRFRKRTVVLLLDPEEFTKASTLDCIAWFEQRMRGQFCAVKLPDGTDPGSLDRKFLREYVRAQAAKKNVEVIYAPRVISTKPISG